MVRDDEGRKYWERAAKDYDRAMAVLGGPIPRMVELAAEAVSGLSRVLEIGAGTGLVTVALARAAQQVIATDYATAMVSKLEQRVREAGVANVQCEQADLYSLRFEPGSFDAVVAANVLHLLPDVPGAMLAVRKMLRPEGRLIVPTYCHDETALSWLVSRLLALTRFPGRRRFTERTLREELEAVGLYIVRSEMLPGVIPIGYVEGTFGGTQT